MRALSSIPALLDLSYRGRCGPQGLLANPALFYPCPEVSRAGQAAGTLERNKISSALLCGYCRTCSVLLRPLLWRLVTAPRWSGRCHVAHVILDDITATVAVVGARWSWLCHTVEKVQNHIPKWEGALFQSWQPKVSMISVTFGPFGFPELFAPPCFLGFQICRWSLVQHRRAPWGQGWRYWITPSSQGPAVLRLLFRHRELERSSLSWRPPVLGTSWGCSVTSRTLEAGVSFEGVSPVIVVSGWFYDFLTTGAGDPFTSNNSLLPLPRVC